MVTRGFALGLDDTDGYKGGCTTHVVFSFLKQHPWLELTDYPKLVRNNPNIPWRTRGNGSLAIHFRAEKKDAMQVFEDLIRIVKIEAQVEDNTNPGIILIEEPVPPKIQEFSRFTLTRVMSIHEAEHLSEKYALSVYRQGKARGLIGALSAVGNKLLPDFTFEVLTYRIKKNWGSPRVIDITSAKNIQEKGSGVQFSSYDFTQDVPLIYPHGPDPVYFGVRGNDPKSLVKLIENVVVPLEPLEGAMIFRSNQGTEQHFWFAKEAIEPFHVSIVQGIILSKPQIRKGKHMFFQVKSLHSSRIFDVAVYEPTKTLRKLVSLLEPEDEIRVFGGIRNPEETPNTNIPTINMEKLIVLKTQPLTKHVTPKCENCGHTLKSAGKNKGYKCIHCHAKYPSLQAKIKKESRAWLQGIYLPVLNAQRHLTKPLARYGFEKQELRIPPIVVSPLNPLREEFYLMKTP